MCSNVPWYVFLVVMLRRFTKLIPVTHVVLSGDDGEIHIGKISYNAREVLGHGSHGTVVFK